MTLNKDLLETSEVYRNITALDCFSDEIEELENAEGEFPVNLDTRELDSIVSDYQYLSDLSFDDE
jgi:hypothetical protein